MVQFAVASKFSPFLAAPASADRAWEWHVGPVEGVGGGGGGMQHGGQALRPQMPKSEEAAFTHVESFAT